MSTRKTVDQRIHAETLETLREVRFKLACFGKMLMYARANSNADVRAHIDSGLLRLLSHTRGEDPLQFAFNGVNTISRGQVITEEEITA